MCKYLNLSCCSHTERICCEWASEWAWICNSPPTRNDRKESVFVSIRGRSRRATNISYMLLKSARKLYSQHFRKQVQAILIDGKVFVATVRHLYAFTSIQLDFLTQSLPSLFVFEVLRWTCRCPPPAPQPPPPPLEPFLLLQINNSTGT